jgi:hypothetical protein
MAKDDVVAGLKAQIEALQEQVKAAKATGTTKFRTETTQTPNHFHVAYGQLFSAEFVKRVFPSYFLRHDAENNCDVYDAALKDELKAHTQYALKAFQE